MAKPEILSSVGFIGCGNMGYALLRQFTQHPPKGMETQFFVYDSDEAKAESCANACKATLCASARELAEKSTLIIAAVKPQQFRELLTSLRDALNDKVLISIAAGITLATLRALVPGARVIRVMPNTPVQLGAGVSAWAAAENVPPHEKEAFETLFSASGLLFPLEEKLMDAFTALAGSGPAYVFMLINALAEGGVREGLNKKDALLMAAQTFLGSARMVLELGEHPEVLKDRVTSPGGTTAAGLAALETDAVRSACIKAVAAARARAEELGKG
jgi:pyrroline-5-carboxylate reductase